MGGKLLVETLKQIENKTVKREKQGNEFTVAPMLNKDMAKIDWDNKTAREIKNLVRGLNPIMGAYSMLNGKKIKIWKADRISNSEFMEKYTEFKEYRQKFEDVTPGTIIYIDKKDGVYIKAQDEVIILLEVQAENAKKMSIQDFIRGNKLEVGEVLE